VEGFDTPTILCITAYTTLRSVLKEDFIQHLDLGVVTMNRGLQG